MDARAARAAQKKDQYSKEAHVMYFIRGIFDESLERG